MRILAAVLFCTSAPVHAMGNYSEAGACPQDKPYYAICTHSLHNLEGWFGPGCHTSREAAEKDVKTHAQEQHQGNTRWTGIAKAR